jgi:hypothetical protein
MLIKRLMLRVELGMAIDEKSVCAVGDIGAFDYRLMSITSVSTIEKSVYLHKYRSCQCTLM